MTRGPGIDNGLTSDELPHIGIKATEFLLNFQECLGILDGSIDLEPVADDARVGQQALETF